MPALAEPVAPGTPPRPRPSREGADVLLVQPCFPRPAGRRYRIPDVDLPLSLLYLASALGERGHRVRVLDLERLDRGRAPLREALERHRPRIVGVTGFTVNAVEAQRVARDAKTWDPSLLTVLGGPHASALPERALREAQACDLSVFGEGERTLGELADRVLGAGGGGRAAPDVSGIAGVAWRDGERVVLEPARVYEDDLDRLPFPDRTLVDVHGYVPNPINFLRLPTTGVLFSRGCPYTCSFCSNEVWGRKLRYRSAANMLAELEQCRERWGVRDVRFFDDMLTANRRRLLELCDGIEARGLDLSWNCFSRVDTVDPELLRRMRDAGCYHVKYGVESGNPRSLALVDKRITLEKIRRTIEWTRAVGIETQANVILGFPGETEAEQRETTRFVRSLPLDLVTYHAFKPLPGSPLFDRLETEGKLRDLDWEDFFLRTPAELFEGGSPAELQRRMLRHAYLSFYLRPRTILRRLARAVVHPARELRTLWLGFRTLAPALLGG